VPVGIVIMVAEFVALVILLRARLTTRQRNAYIVVGLVAFTVLLATATMS
jgi:hypothetical protein